MFRDLKENRKGFDTSELLEASQPRRVEIPYSTSAMVGTEKKVNEILGHLRNERVRRIGIYGQGGIGKTALMKELHRIPLSYTSSLHFDEVIWVVVSKDVDVDKIQDQISEQIGVDLHQVRAEHRAKHLSKILKDKKFLILLDDLWTMLDLTVVGIPLSENNGKVVFTTRLHEVCLDMISDSDKVVKVHLLDETSSRELFRRNVGVDPFSNDSLRQCAAEVVKRCAGLPLSLITIGKAFACYGTKVLEWDSGLQSLMKSPSNITGMEEKLLSRVKLSFDRLGSNELQLCLLYCSLYPCDYNISTTFIIQQWVGEGILQNATGYQEDYTSLRKRGFFVISKLKSASLLESSELGDRFVKMHDSVRDMCLWVTKSSRFSALSYGTYLDYNTADGSSRLNYKEWETSQKVSFIGSKITCIDSPPAGKHGRRPRVTTMLLNYCYSLVKIHEDFFQFVPSLRVLDMTGAKLKELPKSIFLLVELRFLNLKSTNIEELPMEICMLRNLRQLYLENTSHLRLIPKEALLSLLDLQCLCVLQSSFKWGLEGEFSHDSNIQLGHLRNIEKLDEIGIDVKSVTAFKELLKYVSTSPAAKVTALQFIGSKFTDKHASSAYSSFKWMRRFWICNCNKVKDLVFSKGYDSCLEGIYLNDVTNLRSITVERDAAHEVNDIGDANVLPIPRSRRSPLPRLLSITIKGSKDLENLSCVFRIPTLERIRLSNCEALREILPAFPSDQTPTATRKTPFPNLQSMKLDKLPELKSISNEQQPLSFPSLRFLSVSQCPQLKKLPFDHGSAKSIRQIRGSPGWWAKLQWNDDKTGPALSTYFQAGS